MKTSSAALLIAVVLTLVAAPADAQTDAQRKARAANLFRRGSALYSEGDFQGALQMLRAAQQIYPSQKVELSIGYALEKLGQLPEAAEIFARFLESALGKADRARALEVERKLGRLRASLSRVSLSCRTAGALIEIDGAPVSRTPLKHEIYVRPGRHRLSVTHEGRVLYRQELSLKAGESYWGLVDEGGVTSPTRVVASRPTAPVSTPVYKRWWFWVTLGSIAVTGAVVGAVVPNVGGSDRMPRQGLGLIDMR
jgi:tetratricopeptide (TPR) repeat protein